jgi:hypothetical protein
MTPDIIITEVTETMNPDEIVEVLDVDMDVLVEALRDLILDNSDRFIKHLELDQ